MNKAVLLCAVLLLAASFSYGQIEELTPMLSEMQDEESGWNLGGMGGIFFEENPFTGDTDVYVAIGFQPEFGLGKIRLGLDLTIYYNIETGEIRNTDYDENEDYLKLIRYFQYGKNKYEELIWIKAGALDNATIGHGFIINRYKTDVDYDKRQAGLLFNMNTTYVSLESFTNNVFLGEVVGARVGVKPFANNLTPIVKDIAFGFTMAMDVSAPFSLRDTETYDTGTETWSAGADGLPDWDADENFITSRENTLNIIGFDIDMPLIRTEKMIDLTLYVDWAQIRDVDGDSGAFSDGIGTGFKFDFKLWDLTKLYLKTEWRFIDRNFMPNYFDRLYEIQRFQYDTTNIMLTKQALLASLPSSGSYKGIYAEGAIEILGTLEAWGTFQDNMDVPNDGSVSVGIGFKELAGIKAGAQYTKLNIIDNSLKDILTVDDRSLFIAYVQYAMNSFVNVGINFERSWQLNIGTGEYEAVDNYGVGVSFNTKF